MKHLFPKAANEPLSAGGCAAVISAMEYSDSGKAAVRVDVAAKGE